MDMRTLPRTLRPTGPWAAVYTMDVPRSRYGGVMLSVSHYGFALSGGIGRRAALIGWHQQTPLRWLPRFTRCIAV